MRMSSREECPTCKLSLPVPDMADASNMALIFVDVSDGFLLRSKTGTGYACPISQYSCRLQGTSLCNVAIVLYC